MGFYSFVIVVEEVNAERTQILDGLKQLKSRFAKSSDRLTGLPRVL